MKGERNTITYCNLLKQVLSVNFTSESKVFVVMMIAHARKWNIHTCKSCHHFFFLALLKNASSHLNPVLHLIQDKKTSLMWWGKYWTFLFTKTNADINWKSVFSFLKKKVSARCQSLLRQTISQIVKFNLPSNWEQETNKIHKFSSCTLVKASENLYF